MEDRKLRPRRPRSRRKVCRFCVEKATSIDYKDIKKLQGFAVCPACAPSISAISRSRSSARGSWLCCPTAQSKNQSVTTRPLSTEPERVPFFAQKNGLLKRCFNRPSRPSRMVSDAAFFALSYTDVCERAKTRLICGERNKRKGRAASFFHHRICLFSFAANDLMPLWAAACVSP